MNVVARALVPVAILAVGFGWRDVRAAEAPAGVAGQIEAHNKAFLAAYEAGSLPKMKSESAKAVALGEKNGLATDAVMADTYVLAAILEVDGKENKAAGVRNFVKALKIRADVPIPKGMATSPVKAALKQARIEAGLAPKDKDAVAVAPATESPKAAEPPKEPAKEPEKQKAVEAEPAAKKEPPKAKEVATKETVKEPAKEPAKESAKESAKDDKQVADLKTRVQQLGEQVEQLKKDKDERDKQLADAKSHDKQSDKDKAGRDKQLAEAQSRAQQLEKDKANSDKQLADAKSRIQQLEKEKAERDKQLAEAQSREGKEREALDKIEHERQVAEAKEKDAAAKRQQEQQNRERLFAGPPMPSHISEGLHCEVPDEAPLRADLFVHCVARPSLKARTLVFYYRAGTAHYTSVTMERTAKGWYAAIVPGMHVVGKALQYYAQALDAREAVVATNGKEASPNILTLHPAGPRG